MIQYQFFPRSLEMSEQMTAIVRCFERIDVKIASEKHTLPSNEVLMHMKPELEKIGFKVEAGKRAEPKIKVAVLFGLNNRIEKYFDADAVSRDGSVVLEIEAGRAVDNFHFLKDIFEASMMSGVDFLVLAVRNRYRSGRDFQKVYAFLETMFVSGRISLPLKGILLVGY